VALEWSARASRTRGEGGLADRRPDHFVSLAPHQTAPDPGYALCHHFSGAVSRVRGCTDRKTHKMIEGDLMAARDEWLEQENDAAKKAEMMQIDFSVLRQPRWTVRRSPRFSAVRKPQ
jgi:hypothetical protein